MCDAIDEVSIDILPEPEQHFVWGGASSHTINVRDKFKSRELTSSDLKVKETEDRNKF